MKDRIYLDYAATTPLSEEVTEKMDPFLRKNFGNPSSLHSFGQEAVFALDEARSIVADFLGTQARNIIFTASATESNNLALQGVLRDKKNPHVITSSVEHKAVLEPLKASGAEITHLPVYEEGVVRVEDLKKEIKENTVLVSVMYANSEIGTLQPVKEIGDVLREVNKERKERIVLHTDAVQAVNYLSCDVEELGVDLLTLSGHKIYGPKGVGALFVREDVKLSPVFYGASQERGLRPGTENIAGIVGLGAAVEDLKKNDPERTEELRDHVIEGILSSIPGTKLNGDRKRRLPNNVNISFDGVEGEGLLIALDQEGVAVSTGSACASHSLHPSYVLLAIGLSHERAHGSLRITLGRYTTKEEVDKFLEKLPPIVERLRRISGK